MISQVIFWFTIAMTCKTLAWCMDRDLDRAAKRMQEEDDE